MTVPEEYVDGAGHRTARIPAGGRWLTAADLADELGLTVRDVKRFWRALGFPDAGVESRYDAMDLATLRGLKDSLSESGMDIGGGMRLVRAIGQSVARMSDWQVAALNAHAGSAATSSSPAEPSRAEATGLLADRVHLALEQVLVHAWRHHLAAAIERLDESLTEQDAEQSVQVTVGFADLVAFSALSNELDPDRLGELVEIFEARCGDVIATHEGRLIKTLGDSVLFVSESADRAMEIAWGLVDVIGRDSRLPDVSIGLATGPVVTRLGDVFGPPVNLAARLTALARRNRILVDAATAAALAPNRYEVLELTERPVRGFGLVAPIAVLPR